MPPITYIVVSLGDAHMRLESLKSSLRDIGADAYLATDTKNVYYFTGFMDIPEASLGLVVVPERDPVLLVSPLSLAAASASVKDCLVMSVGFGEKIVDKLADVIKSSGAGTVHFDSLSSQTYLELAKRLGIERLGEKMVADPELVLALRGVKDEAELNYIRRAGELASLGVEAGVEAVKPWAKEYEVAAAAEYAMRAAGSEGTSFETIVASGPRSAYPHGLASDRVIKGGDLVTIDLGATFGGYCSDLTRTVVAGEPSTEQLRILNLVAEAQRVAIQKIAGGIEARAVDAVAREVLAGGGCGGYFIHGLGHGVGLSVHESPVLSPGSGDVLREGNVVTAEPGVYIVGFGGARIEDMVLVHENRGSF